MNSPVLSLIAALVSLVILQQTLELWLVRESFSERGVWRWSVLRREYAPLTRRVLDPFLCYSGVIGLLVLRVVGAVAVMAGASWWLPFLFVSSVLLSLRWRGTFNGGSDYMTVVILVALSLPVLFGESPAVQALAVLYIAFQSILSYFISGMVKLRQQTWRRGEALMPFLRSAIYPSVLNGRQLSPSILFVLSWGVILFECCFPLSLYRPTVAVGFLSCGAVFHFVNVFVFGLNRFFLVWVATYPAIYWSALLFAPV